MRYGYVRVSTKEQCIDRQTCCFKNAGVEAKNIYADKACLLYTSDAADE